MAKTYLVTLPEDVTNKLERFIAKVRALRKQRSMKTEVELHAAMSKGDAEAAKTKINQLKDLHRPIHSAAVLRSLIVHAVQEDITVERIYELLADDPVRRGRPQHGDRESQ